MNNLKQLRKRRGMSQTELANGIHVTQQAVAKWERGITNPTADKYPKLAKVLNCTMDDLFAE